MEQTGRPPELEVLEHSEVQAEIDSGQTTTAVRCAAHPSVETYLRCGRCETPICPRCMIQTPVGARCRACANIKKLPMFQVGPLGYLRAVGGALGAAIGGALALRLLQVMVPALGFLGILLMVGLGYIVGEATSLATGRKRGTALGIIAAVALPVGLIVARASIFVVGGADPLLGILVAAASLLSPIWTLLAVAVGAFVAYTRVR